MLTRMYWFAFVVISISLIINVQAPSASTTARVDYDGKRISVHADGVELGEILSMLEKQTGVQFYGNNRVAETVVYANFKNNALSDGIKRILSKCCSHAMLYDGSGRLDTVFVFASHSALKNRSTSNRPQYETPQDDTFMASNEEESEALSVPSPNYDQGQEARRPPPWVNEEPVLPQGLPLGLGNESPPSPVDSTAEDNNLDQIENQPDSSSMDSNAEDISPPEPPELT